jgi:hypothetical protein
VRPVLPSVLVVLAACLAACTSGSGSAEPTTVPTLATTTLPPRDTSTTRPTIVTVPGSPRTTTTLPTELGPGGARIVGTVVGPQGPVGGATVLVERLAGTAVSSARLTTDTAGAFLVASVLGGRYRVRAWRPPDLVQLEPEAFFLGAEEARTLELRVDRFGELNVRVTADADPLPADDFFHVKVFVYSASVSDSGGVLATPRPGFEVQLAGGALIPTGVNSAVTDNRGEALFRARCREPGPSAGEAVVAGQRFPLGLPACARPRG